MLGKKLIFGSTVALAIKIVNAGLLLLLQIMLARMLGVTEFGVYMFALAWVNVLMIPGKLGFDIAALRYVSTYKAKTAWGDLRGFMHSATIIVFLSSIAIGSLFSLFMPLWGNYLTDSQYDTLLLALLLVPILSLLQVQSAILRGLGNIVKSLSPFSIIRHILLIALLIVWYYYNSSATAFKAQMFTIISAMLALILIRHWVKGEATAVWQEEDPHPKYNLQMWIMASLPMMAISGFQAVIAQSDIIMVGMILGPDNGGIYAAMSQLSLMVSMGLVSVNTVLAPAIASLYAQKQKRELQTLVTLSARLSFAVTLVACLLLLLFGKFIISLYGREFSAGYPVLLILIASQSVNAFAGTVGYVMTMTGHQKLFAVVMGFCAGLNIILNLCLIPIFGTLGAATATAITTVLWVIVLAVYSRRRLNISSTAFGI